MSYRSNVRCKWRSHRLPRSSWWWKSTCLDRRGRKYRERNGKTRLMPLRSPTEACMQVREGKQYSDIHVHAEFQPALWSAQREAVGLETEPHHAAPVGLKLTQYVARVVLKLVILLPQPLERQNYRCVPQFPVIIFMWTTRDFNGRTINSWCVLSFLIVRMWNLFTSLISLPENVGNSFSGSVCNPISW